MQPVLFLSHDDPSQVVNPEHPSYQFLTSFSKTLKRPKAIVCISAHWESSVPSISGAERLETVHDFYGFPKSFYELNYDVDGEPNLAKCISKLLSANAIESKIDLRRGIDHGAWCVLKPLFPEADIPTIQLSINPNGTPEEHYELGKAIKQLREQNVLILASGTTTHNLADWHKGVSLDAPIKLYVKEFRDWLVSRLKANDLTQLFDYLNIAPYAKKNHPTQDHILPLFVALGAVGNKDNFSVIDDGYIYGSFAMASYKWEE